MDQQAQTQAQQAQALDQRLDQQTQKLDLKLDQQAKALDMKLDQQFSRTGPRYQPAESADRQRGQSAG